MESGPRAFIDQIQMARRQVASFAKRRSDCAGADQNSKKLEIQILIRHDGNQLMAIAVKRRALVQALRRSRPLIGAAAMIIAAHSGASGTAGPAAATDAFKPLVGNWHCEGYFVASGKPLSSDISFAIDEPSGALIVRHDDRAPGQYHALELWTAGNSRNGFRATIADSYNGSRWLESPGWNGPLLVWTRYFEGKAAEQFAYRMIDPVSLQIDWSVSRGNAPLALGDRLNCKRS